MALGLLVAPRVQAQTTDPHVEPTDPGLVDNPQALSPPVIVEPVYACARAISVTGFVEDAMLEVTISGSAPFTRPGGATGLATIDTPSPLVVGQTITVRQRLGGFVSPPSAPVTVRDHKLDFPGTLPPSELTPLPIFACGKSIASRGHVPGARIEFFSESPAPGGGFQPAVSVGNAFTSGFPVHGVRVTPDFLQGARITTEYGMCAETSPKSAPAIVQPEPAMIPAPTMKDLAFDGGRVIEVTRFLNGAELRFFIDGTFLGVAHPIGAIPAPPDGLNTALIALDPFTVGRKITVTERLCRESPPSIPVTVRACAEMPAPRIAQPKIGDTKITVTEAVPGARIRIFGGAGEEIGDGIGLVIGLTRPIKPAEFLRVTQSVGSCTSPLMYVVGAACNKPTVLPTRAGDSVHAINFQEYDFVDPTPFPGERIHGRIWYPKPGIDEDPGTTPAFGSPASGALGSGGYPIVFFQHAHAARFRKADRSAATCSPGPDTVPQSPHAGFDDALQALARAGFIAVSIDAEAQHCVPGITGPANIDWRVNLMRQHIRLFARAATSSSTSFVSKFRSKINMAKVGLVGHSRGGTAVLRVAAEGVGVPGVTLKGVLALAPTNQFVELNTPDIPLMMILPAADGDVRFLSGSQVYDAARTQFKTQLYVHGANHNFFSSELQVDDVNPWQPQTAPRLTAEAQRAILNVYARSFFGFAVGTPFVPALAGPENDVLVGDTRYADLPNDSIFFSSESVGSDLPLRLLESHEPPPVFVNDTGQSVTRVGFTRADELPFFSVFDGVPPSPAIPFNDSFVGRTLGFVGTWERRLPNLNHPLAPFARDQSAARFFTIRAAAIANPDEAAPPDPGALFDLTLRDGAGVTATVLSDSVGGVPPPYARTRTTLKDSGLKYVRHTVLTTLRFPLQCLKETSGGSLALNNLAGARISPRGINGRIALDQLLFTQK